MLKHFHVRVYSLFMLIPIVIPLFSRDKSPRDGLATANISPKITTRINVMKDDYEPNEHTNFNGPERGRITVSRNQRTLEDVADAKLQPTPRHRMTSLQTILVQKNSIQIL